MSRETLSNDLNEMSTYNYHLNHERIMTMLSLSHIQTITVKTDLIKVIRKE